MRSPQSWTQRAAAARIDCGSHSAAGPRPDNQDRCAVAPCWAVVSDGLGGHRGGAHAAEVTVDAVVHVLSTLRGHEEYVAEQALDAAQRAVESRRASEVACAEMCATVTFALVTSCRPERSRWLVTNVGDSPAWRVSAGEIVRLTEDHNLAAELVRAGTISSAAAMRHPGRHMVTRAIGLADRAGWPRHRVALGPGDALVLGSDGLSELLDGAGGAALRQRLLAGGRGAGGAQALAERLVSAALDIGASDNVTAVVLRHLG